MLSPSLNRITFALATILGAIATAPFPCQAAETSRKEKVLNDRAQVQASGLWIYNDLEQARAEARRTGKPLLVALRCVP